MQYTSIDAVGLIDTWKFGESVSTPNRTVPICRAIKETLTRVRASSQ